MGTPVGFWALLRRGRRVTEVWRYWPAAGLPVWLSMGRLTDAPGTWFVWVSRKGVESLLCASEAEARADRRRLGFEVMAACGPGRWERTEPT